MTAGECDCDPIIVADGGLECEHCGRVFDPDADDAVTATFPGLPDLCRCPACEHWTEEPEPKPEREPTDGDGER